MIAVVVEVEVTLAADPNTLLPNREPFDRDVLLKVNDVNYYYASANNFCRRNVNKKSFLLPFPISAVCVQLEQPADRKVSICHSFIYSVSQSVSQCADRASSS